MIRAASIFTVASLTLSIAYASEEPRGYSHEAADDKYAPVDEYEEHPVTFEPLPPVAEYVPKAEPTTPPSDFVAPTEPYPSHKEAYECTETAQPNSAKYMSFVCSSLYASALKWSNNNCKAYYAASSVSDKNSLYQARLCTYWTEKSVLNVVSSCFMEAHLRTEFIQKHGKEGPGVWFCKYKEFVSQVLDCYSGSLKYYPLGGEMNSLEASVADMYDINDEDMPRFKFTGSSVAMCAYYNKDQVYHRGDY